MVIPISDYISPISPLPNEAPFTYKDGATYLSELERFRTYVNTTLVSFINDNFALFDSTFTTEINTLIGQVDAVLSAQNAENVANLAAVNTAIANMNAAITTAEGIIAAAEADAATSATNAAASATTAGTDAANAGTSATAAAASATAAGNDATNAAASAVAAAASAALGYVHSVVAGANVTINNADPHNPIITAAAGGGGGGGVALVHAGTNVTVDNTDPTNPIINVTDTDSGGGSGITSITPGSFIVVDNTIPTAPVVGIDQTQLSLYPAPFKIPLMDTNSALNVADVTYAGTAISNTKAATLYGKVDSVVAGAGIIVDNTDIKNPIVKTTIPTQIANNGLAEVTTYSDGRVELHSNQGIDSYIEFAGNLFDFQDTYVKLTQGDFSTSGGASTRQGQIAYDNVSNQLVYSNGTNWIHV